MFCKNCGEQLEDDALICTKCGAATEKSQTTQTQQPPQTTSQPLPPPVQQQYQYQQPAYQQPTYQQPQYQQPTYQQPFINQQNYAVDEHVSVGGWIGIFCINLIPIVGWLIFIIMLFVWAFGSTPKKTLKNFAKAMLIIWLIVFVLAIIAVIIAGIAGVNLSHYVNSSTYNFTDIACRMFF